MFIAVDLNKKRATAISFYLHSNYQKLDFIKSIPNKKVQLPSWTFQILQLPFQKRIPITFGVSQLINLKYKLKFIPIFGTFE